MLQDIDIYIQTVILTNEMHAIPLTCSFKIKYNKNLTKLIISYKLR